MPSQCRDSLVETRESRTPSPSLVCEKILFIVSKHDSKSNHFWRKTDFINYDIYIFFNRAGSMLHSSFHTLEVLEEVGFSLWRNEPYYILYVTALTSWRINAQQWPIWMSCWRKAEGSSSICKLAALTRLMQGGWLERVI